MATPLKVREAPYLAFDVLRRCPTCDNACMQPVVVDPSFWNRLDSFFPLAHDLTIVAHDFVLLELAVAADQLKQDYEGRTTGSFLVNASIRVFMLRPSFVLGRDVGVYCLEDDEGVVHLIHIELAP